MTRLMYLFIVHVLPALALKDELHPSLGIAFMNSGKIFPAYDEFSITLIGDLPKLKLPDSDAIKQIFGNRIPPVTANKSLFGHAMGASSAIESIFSFMGMISQKLCSMALYETRGGIFGFFKIRH